MSKLLTALVVALTVAGAAHGQAADPNRLFRDSQLVVRDRISVEVVGHGPDLVLIPGLSSSRATWRATAERLKDHYRLHLVQVAGFSGEPARANAAGEVLSPTEEAVDAYIREAKLSPATVIGHSLGGTMTLMLAERRPADVKKALVVDALPFYGMTMAGPSATPESMKAAAEHKRDQTASADAAQYRTSLARMVAGMAQSPERQAMLVDWGVASDRSVVARALYEDLQTDLRPDLGRITAPIILLYPDYAPVHMPPGMTARLYTAAFAPAPSVKPVEVQQSLHFIMFDQPDAFARALDAFLAP